MKKLLLILVVGLLFSGCSLFEEEYKMERKNTEINVITSKYIKSDLITSCTICSEDYNDNDDISSLSCEHVYHTKCIVEWGHYNPCCPVCRKDIPIL